MENNYKGKNLEFRRTYKFRTDKSLILKEEEQHLLDNLLTAYNQSQKGVFLNKLHQLAYFFDRLNKRAKEDVAESSNQAIIQELQLSLPSELQDKLKQEAVRLLKEKFQEHLQAYFLNRKSETEVWKLNDCYGISFKSPISVFTEEMRSLMDHGLLQYVHGSIHMNMDKAPKILTDFIRHVSEKSIMRSIRIHISSIHPEYYYKNTELEFIPPYHVLMVYFSAAQPLSYSNPDDGSQESAELCDFDQESFYQLVPKERALEKFRAMAILRIKRKIDRLRWSYHFAMGTSRILIFSNYSVERFTSFYDKIVNLDFAASITTWEEVDTITLADKTLELEEVDDEDGQDFFNQLDEEGWHNLENAMEP